MATILSQEEIDELLLEEDDNSAYEGTHKYLKNFILSNMDGILGEERLEELKSQAVIMDNFTYNDLKTHLEYFENRFKSGVINPIIYIKFMNVLLKSLSSVVSAMDKSEHILKPSVTKSKKLHKTAKTNTAKLIDNLDKITDNYSYLLDHS